MRYRPICVNDQKGHHLLARLTMTKPLKPKSPTYIDRIHRASTIFMSKVQNLVVKIRSKGAHDIACLWFGLEYWLIQIFFKLYTISLIYLIWCNIWTLHIRYMVLRTCYVSVGLWGSLCCKYPNLSHSWHPNFCGVLVLFTHQFTKKSP